MAYQVEIVSVELDRRFALLSNGEVVKIAHLFRDEEEVRSLEIATHFVLGPPYGGLFRVCDFDKVTIH